MENGMLMTPTRSSMGIRDLRIALMRIASPLPAYVGEGPSLERSWEILMASSIAANNPSPPSPRRAGPKHSEDGEAQEVEVAFALHGVPADVRVAVTHQHHAALQPAARQVLHHLHSAHSGTPHPEESILAWKETLRRGEDIVNINRHQTNNTTGVRLFLGTARMHSTTLPVAKKG
ncbi:hypothetical protein EYF80_026900 [Liparis tanakae]|uniref:Uncharacterized protein n=1 Tax=Liparis tanakae TaxID=230148 RepID=A0A4Z2HC22_9TELE|nr:hypothetical protein EYF80_026900 [Liparis tanakae]